MPPLLFNPLDKDNLGKSVVNALMATAAIPLNTLPKFVGAGTYAIYYAGGFTPYAKLAALNQQTPFHPIYVGKAIPQGGRKGIAKDASSNSDALYKRLSEHADSIKSTKDLAIDDFCCRYLAVDDIFISLGESLLIQKFNPLWNQVVEGFGNHHPGKGRKKGRRPLWDELHPGRKWATSLPPAKMNKDDILKLVALYMDSLPPPIS